MLLDLVDQNIEHVSTLLEVHEANADLHAERTVARLRFDPSPEGEVLRNYQMTCTNRLFRGIETYRRYKAGAKAGRREADPLGRQPMGPARPFEGGGVPRGGPFGLDAGLDDWIERADTIDAGGVRNDRDDTRDLTEIVENATSRANFEEHADIVETPAAATVTANPSALSGLDKGMAQSGDDDTEELGEIGGQAIENRKSKIENNNGLAQLDDGGKPHAEDVQGRPIENRESKIESSSGPICENLTREANFQEGAGIVDPPNAATATADSGAPSGPRSKPSDARGQTVCEGLESRL